MKNNIISAFGAFLCISVLAYLNSFDESNLWLIPPFGASMVLVMAAHESPLAHPKNVLFGHILSALSGVFVYSILGFSFLSVGLAVGLAIFLMMITKTMLAPNGGINHKLLSSKELRYASAEMHKNAPKAEIILFFI